MAERRLCRLHDEECEEGSCAFWEPDGPILTGHCGIDYVDLTASPELGRWLLALRRRLEAVHPLDEPPSPRQPAP